MGFTFVSQPAALPGRRDDDSNRRRAAAAAAAAGGSSPSSRRHGEKCVVSYLFYYIDNEVARALRQTPLHFPTA